MAEENENQFETEGEAFDDAFDSAFDEAVGESVPGPEDTVPAEPQAQQESLQDIGQANNTSVASIEEGSDNDDGADYQHKYSSAMGRLKASQAQNKELSDQIAQMREQLAAFQAGMQSSAQQDTAERIEVDGLEDVPEELHSLFQDDSADGKRLRRMLEEYGADYAIPIAETVKERRELQMFRAQAERDRDTRVEEDHFSRIANAVPEYADALVGQNRQAKFNELVQGVQAWIGTLPYGEGVAMDRVVKEGTPDEVISMLRSYSKFRNGSSGRGASAVRNLARSNMAVPASRSAPQTKQISKDDFDSAFDEFARL